MRGRSRRRVQHALEEIAQRVPETDLRRLHRVHGRGAPSPRRRVRRGPSDLGNRLSLPVECDRGRPHHADARPERRRSRRDARRQRGQAARAEVGKPGSSRFSRWYGAHRRGMMGRPQPTCPVMAKGIVLLLGVSALLYAGCARSSNPAAPAQAQVVTPMMTNAWAPCVVVQSPGGTAFTTQMNAVSKLQRAGRMSWIRLNTHLDGSGVEYHLEAKRMGLRIFSIVALQDLERAGWQSAFDRLYAMYPS